jgi:hypothetical protein
MKLRNERKRGGEWEQVESGSMRRMPVDKQRSRIESAIGGVSLFVSMMGGADG